MAKAKKRSTKSSARNKPARKSAAKKATAKKAAMKKAPAKKAAAKKSPSKTASPVTKKTAPRAKVEAPKGKPVKPAISVQVKSPQAEQPPKKAAPQSDASPDTRKKIAAQHMWDLVQAKKQRATQTPAWQAIQHHDHPAPRASSDLSSDQGGSSVPPEMPGHRDRGTG